MNDTSVILIIIVLLLGMIGGYLLFNKNKEEPSKILTTNILSQQDIEDIKNSIRQLQNDVVKKETNEKVLYYYPQYPNPYLLYDNIYYRRRDRDRIHQNQNLNVNVPYVHVPQSSPIVSPVPQSSPIVSPVPQSSPIVSPVPQSSPIVSPITESDTTNE